VCGYCPSHVPTYLTLASEQIPGRAPRLVGDLLGPEPPRRAPVHVVAACDPGDGPRMPVGDRVTRKAATVDAPNQDRVRAVDDGDPGGDVRGVDHVVGEDPTARGGVVHVEVQDAVASGVEGVAGDDHVVRAVDLEDPAPPAAAADARALDEVAGDGAGAGPVRLAMGVVVVADGLAGAGCEGAVRDVDVVVRLAARTTFARVDPPVALEAHTRLVGEVAVVEGDVVHPAADVEDLDAVADAVLIGTDDAVPEGDVVARARDEDKAGAVAVARTPALEVHVLKDEVVGVLQVERAEHGRTKDDYALRAPDHSAAPEIAHSEFADAMPDHETVSMATDDIVQSRVLDDFECEQVAADYAGDACIGGRTARRATGGRATQN